MSWFHLLFHAYSCFGFLKAILPYIGPKKQPIQEGFALKREQTFITAYKDWFPRMVEYGFLEGADFCSNLSESTGRRRSTDHIIKLDMAKEIAMIQRSDGTKLCHEKLFQKASYLYVEIIICTLQVHIMHVIIMLYRLRKERINDTKTKGPY